MFANDFFLDIGGSSGPLKSGTDWFALLTDVVDERVEFAILSEEKSGWFVQTAGSNGSLIVEYQVHPTDGDLTHYRLCRPGLGSAGLRRRPPRVPGYQGYLEKEVLEVLNAVEIFESFLNSLAVPDKYELCDVTAELGIDS